MYQFVKSIKNKDTYKFKDIFRNADVLILDDIQFISGKDVTQEEFFYTFNSLIENQSQVVISSDRSPNDSTGYRMNKVKIIWWPCCRYTAPDILKTRNLKKDVCMKKTSIPKISISDEILTFIANEFKSSIRDMLGVLNRIIASSRIQNKIQLQDAKLILKDLFSNMNTTVNIEDIQKIVVNFYDISLQIFYQPDVLDTLRPRQIAMYLSKKLTTKSLPEIGRKFTGRDHTTVIHAIKKVEDLMHNDKKFEQEVQEISNRILKK